MGKEKFYVLFEPEDLVGCEKLNEKVQNQNKLATIATWQNTWKSMYQGDEECNNINHNNSKYSNHNSSSNSNNNKNKTKIDPELGFFVVSKRGGCSFIEKAKRAQEV